MKNSLGRHPILKSKPVLFVLDLTCFLWIAMASVAILTSLAKDVTWGVVPARLPVGFLVSLGLFASLAPFRHFRITYFLVGNTLGLVSIIVPIFELGIFGIGEFSSIILWIGLWFVSSIVVIFRFSIGDRSDTSDNS